MLDRSPPSPPSPPPPPTLNKSREIFRAGCQLFGSCPCPPPQKKKNTLVPLLCICTDDIHHFKGSSTHLQNIILGFENK